MPNPHGRLVTATQGSHRGYLAESSHAKRWSCLCTEAWFSLFLLAPALAASGKNLTLNDLRVRAHPVLSASIPRAHPVAGNMSAPIPQTIIAFIYVYLISWELSQCVHVYSWGAGPRISRACCQSMQTAPRRFERTLLCSPRASSDNLMKGLQSRFKH